MTIVTTSQVFDGARWLADATIEIEAGRVTGVDAREVMTPGAAPSSVDDWFLAPGFVDLQVNGGGGVLFNQALDRDGLRHIAMSHAQAGTTSLLPTLISGSRDEIARALAVTQSAIGREPGVAGVHIEGPFINRNRRGIHPERAITEVTDRDVGAFEQPRSGTTLLTVAPECADPRRLRTLADAGCILFAGHTDATFEQALAAFEDVVAGATHLFNAMSQFGSREPGVVGACLAHNRCAAGLICDGFHVHPASVRVAHQAMGAARLFLVSDAMPTAASDCSGFTWDGQAIALADGKLVTADGRLAGAHLTMAQAVKTAVELCGVGLTDALRMATSTPAHWAKLHHVGRIAAGYRADMVALDSALRVVAVWQNGVKLV